MWVGFAPAGLTNKVSADHKVSCSGLTAHVVVCFLFMRKTLRDEMGEKNIVSLE